MVEIENDDGPRGSETERQVKEGSQDDHSDQGVDHASDDARGTQRKPEDEGERENAKRQDRMIVSCLSGEKSTRRRNEVRCLTR